MFQDKEISGDWVIFFENDGYDGRTMTVYSAMLTVTSCKACSNGWLNQMYDEECDDKDLDNLDGCDS